MLKFASFQLRAVQIEIGHPNNPLSFSWLSGDPTQSTSTTTSCVQSSVPVVAENTYTSSSVHSTSQDTQVELIMCAAASGSCLYI